MSSNDTEGIMIAQRYAAHLNNYRIYSICAAGVLLFLAKNQGLNPSNSAARWYYSRVRYYFILICHYELLYNIRAYKQSQYIATYFSMQELCFKPVIKGQACQA